MDEFLSTLELVLLCWSFFLCLDFLFLLFPALAAPELLYFELLVSEPLFILIDFLYSARMDVLLASVHVWKSLYRVLFILSISSSNISKA